jgi:hypothetical protein
MWDLPRWYISACSNSVQYVRLHPILMSILLYHFKQLTACISEVQRIEGRESQQQEKREGLTIKKEYGKNSKKRKKKCPLVPHYLRQVFC